MLEKELEIFKSENAKLKAENPNGGFVVIKDSEILGVWSSRIDALKQGIEKYGDVPFLVKNINETGPVINFSRNLSLVNYASISK